MPETMEHALSAALEVSLVAHADDDERDEHAESARDGLVERPLTLSLTLALER
jgi:hypothetical protein